MPIIYSLNRSNAICTLSIHFSHHDIDAAEDNHDVGHGVAEAKVFQHSQIDEARRADAVTIRIRAAVADQIETELAFGRFDAPVGFADRRTKARIFTFGFMIGPAGNLLERLLQDSDALAHLQRAHHQSIVGVAVFPKRNPKFEPRIESIAIHFANIVVHAARAQASDR